MQFNNIISLIDIVIHGLIIHFFKFYGINQNAVFVSTLYTYIIKKIINTNAIFT